MTPLFGVTSLDEPVPPATEKEVALFLVEHPQLMAAFEVAQPAPSAPAPIGPSRDLDEPNYTPTSGATLR